MTLSHDFDTFRSLITVSRSRHRMVPASRTKFEACSQAIPITALGRHLTFLRRYKLNLRSPSPTNQKLP